MKKGMRTGLTILLAVVLIFGAGNLVLWYLDSKQNAQSNEEAQQLVNLPESDPPLADTPAIPSETLPAEEPFQALETEPVPTPMPEPTPEPDLEDPLARTLLDTKLAELQDQNPDVVGWIIIPDTPISYPLLQGEDNEYYLKHSWKKERNSGGSIFMECQNSTDFSDFNTLIYGHRMRDTSMFNALQYYEDADYLAQHPRIYIVTNDGVRVYEIFASGKVTITDPVYWLIKDQEEYKQRMLEFCLEHSAVDAGIIPTTTDHILTLSTCTSVRGSDNRWVVVAVQIGVINRITE